MELQKQIAGLLCAGVLLAALPGMTVTAQAERARAVKPVVRLAAAGTGVSILTHPFSQTVNVNTIARLTVRAAGTGLTYRWQQMVPGGSWEDCNSGSSDGDTFWVLGLEARDGIQYRCIVTAPDGKQAISGTATVRVRPQIQIVDHPQDAVVYENDSAEFTAHADGVGILYHWQYLAPGKEWANCTSSTSGYISSVLRPQATLSQDGFQYRCVITNSRGMKMTSSPAALTVTPAVVITQQPVDVLEKENVPAAFTVAAEGRDLTYQWQYLAPNGKWADCTAATEGYHSAALSPVATIDRNGYSYRCIITSASGISVTSEAAALRIDSPILILSQPRSQVVRTGDEAEFTVSAQGSGLKYQWQYMAVGGSWADCTSATVGYNTATLRPVSADSRNGHQYRCMVTDAEGHSLYSAPATLTTEAAITITGQPKDQTVREGQSAAFSVTVLGNGLKYQWQYMAAGGSWADCSGATVGYDTTTLRPVAELSRSGHQYRCVITDSLGNKLTSDAVTLTVEPAIVITRQPQDQTVPTGSMATFTVQATGTKLTYLWQYRKPGGDWADSSAMTQGYNTATLSPLGSSTRDGYQYRCIITDADGNRTISDPATLRARN